MPVNQTFVTQLLRTYHGRTAICAERFRPPDIKQVRYLCDVGLGPIAFGTYGEVLSESDPETYSILHSADLTTRVIYMQMETATVELLASLHSAGVSPTLLKGISTAYEYYDPHHLRLMGDVDMLVSDSEVDVTMRTLSDLGYEIADQYWLKYRAKGHHHLPGARNPKSGLTVEIHTRLIPLDEPMAQEPLFDLENIESQKREFDYSGVPATRFTPEFQLVYTIAHWGLDGNWAVNLTSINDTIHILRKHESEFNWSILAGWIAANSRLYANIAVLANYLERADIVTKSPQMREALASSKHELEPRTSQLLMWLLHNYPLNARGKTHDGYAAWRAHAMWQELTHPTSRDARIPYSLLRVAIKSAHHGKYNPLRWLLFIYRYFTSRLRSD